MKYLTKTMKLLPLTLLLGIVGCNEDIYTDKLNVEHMRVAPKLNYYSDGVVTFCASDEFFQYSGSETFLSVELPDGTLSNQVISFHQDFRPGSSGYEYNKGDVNINDYPEYQECGHGKKYPYIYVFKVSLFPYNERTVKELDIISKQLLTNKHLTVRLNFREMNDKYMSEKYILPFTDEQIEEMLATYNLRFNKTLPQNTE